MLYAPHDQFVWVWVTRFKVPRSTTMLSAPHDQFVWVCVTRFKVPCSTTLLCAPHDQFVLVCITRFKVPRSTTMLCARLIISLFGFVLLVSKPHVPPQCFARLMIAILSIQEYTMGTG